jgi:hypothetical protein
MDQRHGAVDLTERRTHGVDVSLDDAGDHALPTEINLAGLWASGLEHVGIGATAVTRSPRMATASAAGRDDDIVMIAAL